MYFTEDTIADILVLAEMAGFEKEVIRMGLMYNSFVDEGELSKGGRVYD